MNAVGVCDGAIRSRRYFQCPQSHGVFVLPKHILCVTGRRVSDQLVHEQDVMSMLKALDFLSRFLQALLFHV